MKFQYHKIDIRTIAGIKKAEKLLALGWKAIDGGIESVLLEKEVKS